MIIAVKPIMTVKTNMESRLYASMAPIVLELLAMKMSPPLTKQKEARSSVGGLDGRYVVGGLSQKVT